MLFRFDEEEKCYVIIAAFNILMLTVNLNKRYFLRLFYLRFILPPCDIIIYISF